MRGHEIYSFRSNFIGGNGKVALIFTVFVIDNDEHAASPEFFEGAGDVGKGCVRFESVGSRHGFLRQVLRS
jgi:hypothetical protein